MFQTESSTTAVLCTHLGTESSTAAVHLGTVAALCISTIVSAGINYCLDANSSIAASVYVSLSTAAACTGTIATAVACTGTTAAAVVVCAVGTVAVVCIEISYLLLT